MIRGILLMECSRLGSTCEHFVPHKMKPDDFWSFALVEMALDGVPHLLAKMLQRFGFSKDGMTQSARRKTTFGRLFDEKYQFVHFVRANRPLMLPTISAILRSLSRVLCLIVPTGLSHHHTSLIREIRGEKILKDLLGDFRERI
jgi:hypothetical protein